MHRHKRIIMKKNLVKIINEKLSTMKKWVKNHKLNFVLVIGFNIVLIYSLNSPSNMTRAQNTESQNIQANEWIGCEFGYYSVGKGVEFLEDDSFTIDKKYSGAMLTVNVEVEEGRFATVRITGEGDYSLEQMLVSVDSIGSAVYPIQNVHDFYKVDLYSPEDTIIKLCRISIIPYK